MGLLAARTDIPSEILAKAQTLDLYYIPARYPNGLASGKPADYFNRDKAKEALDAAGGIQRFCESLLYLTAMRYWSARGLFTGTSRSACPSAWM
jgi:HEPN domain-containing protein